MQPHREQYDHRQYRQSHATVGDRLPCDVDPRFANFRHPALETQPNSENMG